MEQGTIWRGILLAALMAMGCTGTRAAGTGGAGWGEEQTRPWVDGAALEEGRRAEAESALAHLRSMASEVREEGARLTLAFWVQNGALTLLEYRREELGRRQVMPVEAETFARQLRPLLREYVRERTGEVVLTLRRDEAGWAVDYEATSQGSRPLEAKTQPVNRRDVPADTADEVFAVASSIVRLLPVPSGGAAALRVEVMLEDDRITGWEHRGYEVTESGGKPQALAGQMAGQLARVLLPFTHGIGQRTVFLEVRGEHQEGESTARGHVLEARTLRPAPLSNMDPDFAAEYRAMHEEILRRWREGVREGAELLAGYAAEEMALWCVGGILTRGAGLLFESMAPTVRRALARGGTDAAGWLRTTLFRLAPGERRAFDRLWTKVQMEGAGALSGAEKNVLLTLMNNLERRLRAPLSISEKESLRGAARRYYKKFQISLHEAMRLKGSYEVHHRRPLEYAHFFPDEDINAPANLRAVGEEVHQHISTLWTEFRHARANANAAEVEKMVALIDEHFSRWYDMPHAPGDSATALGEAADAARRELKKMLPQP